MSIQVSALPRAHGDPVLRATIRSQPEDFEVTELRDFEPSGAGEHVWLEIRKRGANTEWVARQLARFAGVPEVAVGFAGLKDRDALTRQVFTVGLGGQPEPDWDQCVIDGVELLARHRHARKLKRGALNGNRFELILRSVQPLAPAAAIEARLSALSARGVPNYFGPQRFGRGGENVARALAMFDGARVPRSLRGILLSAARSQIFNQLLAGRVLAGSWEQAIDGDILQLERSNSVFKPAAIDADIAARMAAGEINSTGPLWGASRSTINAAGADEAQSVAADAELNALAAGLLRAGLEADRRALRLWPRTLSWQWLDGQTLRLEFALREGAYATSVLAELGETADA